MLLNSCPQHMLFLHSRIILQNKMPLFLNGQPTRSMISKGYCIYACSSPGKKVLALPRLIQSLVYSCPVGVFVWLLTITSFLFGSCLSSLPNASPNYCIRMAYTFRGFTMELTKDMAANVL